MTEMTIANSMSHKINPKNIPILGYNTPKKGRHRAVVNPPADLPPNKFETMSMRSRKPITDKIIFTTIARVYLLY